MTDEELMAKLTETGVALELVKMGQSHQLALIQERSLGRIDGLVSSAEIVEAAATSAPPQVAAALLLMGGRLRKVADDFQAKSRAIIAKTEEAMKRIE